MAINRIAVTPFTGQGWANGSENYPAKADTP